MFYARNQFFMSWLLFTEVRMKMAFSVPSLKRQADNVSHLKVAHPTGEQLGAIYH